MRATDVGLHPRVLVTEPGDAKVRTVVLVLPGGQSRSKIRARSWQLAQLRMIPFARVAARAEQRARGRGVAAAIPAPGLERAQSRSRPGRPVGPGRGAGPASRARG